MGSHHQKLNTEDFNIMKHMKLNRATLIMGHLGLLVLGSSSCHASNLLVSIDNYDYSTNLADIDLDYSPVGSTIAGRFDLDEMTFMQLQFGRWSASESGLLGSGIANADFDSTLANIGIGHSWGSWDLFATYTDLDDEILLVHGRDLEFRSVGETDSSAIQISLGFTSESGNWSRTARLGLQLDDAVTMALLDQESRVFRQESEASYATMMLGADYFYGASESKGWIIGTNISWYQEFSSSDSVSQFGIGLVPSISDENRVPVSAQGNSGRPNNGQNGGAAIGINRTFGESFGVLSLYATYMINHRWSLDFSPSFGFAGDVNANSAALTLNYNF